MKTNNRSLIHYGFGREYLPKWGIKEALREVYQNFIDYGEYEESVSELAEELVCVTLKNGWQPENLEYLRIGNSKKEKENSVGHHGEGLKMAFLIFLREGLHSTILTNKYSVNPVWYTEKEIGECFALEYETHGMHEAQYGLSFWCPNHIFESFKEDLITEKDIEYTDRAYGDIVSKTPGNIYSGNLFVANLEGMSRAYNILPKHLPLDRDRCVPRVFDVEWATSMLLQGSEKLTTKDLTYSDTRYVKHIPERLLKEFKPHRVGNSVEFSVKNENGESVVIQNHALKETLKEHGFFQKAIQGIKRFLAKQLGVYDLLLEFKKKHSLTAEAMHDLDVIIDKVNK